MGANDLSRREGYDLMAAVFEVYNEKGHGFLESVSHECLEKELTWRSLPFQAKSVLQLFYKGQPLQQGYQPDLLVCEGNVVELKAVQKLAPEHDAQLINYLKALQKRVGYLINFGHHPSLEWKRMVL